MKKQSDVPSNLSSGSPTDLSGIPVGKHCILELLGCPSDQLNDVAHIEAALREAALVAKSTLLKQVSYQFEPCGVTALALLAESHISVHTWPESGYVAIDVFTCGQHTQPEQACHYLVEAFQSSQHSLTTLNRGRFSAKLQSLIQLLEDRSHPVVPATA